MARIVPIHPTDFAVLAVNIVVTMLRAAQFVAVRDHRNTLRKQQGGQHVTFLAFPQSNDLAVLGGTLHATVPRAVVTFPVAVVFAVFFVVFVIVRHQIVQRKPIVRGHEIDRSDGSAIICLIEI